MAEPARKKDTEKVLPEADALPESSFNNDLSFDEGFGEMTPMAPEPISVRDVPINPDSLSEDSDAPLEMQPDVDIENNNEDESSQQTLASEDEVEDLVGEFHLGQHVAGHELAFDLHLLAALDLGHGFGRHFDRFDELREAHAFGLGNDRLANLVLEAGIGVNDVPAGHMSLLAN